MDDLASLDPELYTGLMFLKNYAGNVEADLSLNFTVTQEGEHFFLLRFFATGGGGQQLTRLVPDFGVAKTIELIPNGSDIPVTNDNRISYIYLTSNHRLNTQIEKQCAAFFAGLSEIIPPRALRMFNQTELRMLVGESLLSFFLRFEVNAGRADHHRIMSPGGVDQPINLEDLRLHTVYGGFAGDEANATIIDFWSVLQDFTKEDRTKLIKFVTACERPPLLGFSELVPRFAIRAAGLDEIRLPTSSSCVNLLKLPQYSSKEIMKQ